VFENVAANVVTLMWATAGSGAVRDLSRIVRFEGWRNWQAAHATGAVVATTHTGNWDLVALAAAQRGMALTVLSRNLSYAPMDRMWNRARVRAGLQILDDSANLSDITMCIGPGRALALMIDQRTGPARGGIRLPFLWREAWTSTLAAAVAIRSAVPLLSATSRTAPDGRIEVCIEEPVRSIPLPSAMAQIRENTNIVTGRLESWILRYPDSWLWLHRRWASERATSSGAGEGMLEK
jgi:KDO2-lipid IV(A) lauroyltransferase